MIRKVRRIALHIDPVENLDASHVGCIRRCPLDFFPSRKSIRVYSLIILRGNVAAQCLISNRRFYRLAPRLALRLLSHHSRGIHVVSRPKVCWLDISLMGYGGSKESSPSDHCLLVIHVGCL